MIYSFYHHIKSKIMKDKINCSVRFFIVISTGLILFLFLGNTVMCQEPITGEINQTCKVTLNDGSVITGRLLQMTGREIVIFSGAVGEMHIQRENIKSITPVSTIDEKRSGIWFANPNPSKYLIGSSAIPPEKHTGYYQNTWIFVNSFSYAFTRNFSLAGGFEIISLLAKGGGPYAYYLNPKVSFKIAGNFYAGTNFLYANTIQTTGDFGGLATLNAFATYGNRNNNLTAAIGWGWADGNISDRPLITLSGMVRVSKRIGFVSENWIIPGVKEGSSFYGIYSYGIRFLGEKTSIDLAFLNNSDISTGFVLGIPWLDFVINF